ncbi:MAG: 40S ribosomal protein S19 [Nanoarchaeota archaeon]|nr:40S ribosomal protein S19 [Nanoarchaeota archaeon]
MTVKSIEAGKYNKLLAEALKKSGFFEKPDWVNYVKTGVSKARPNIEEDFWFKRAASILKQVYVREIVGIERLRTRYGGKKDRGAKPSKFFKGGGKIIRTIMQQAEKAGLVEKVKGKKFGRKLTQKGKEFLEGVVKEAKE